MRTWPIVLMLSAASVAAGQGRSDVIRGHVTTDSGRVVADAQIIVTMAPTRVTVEGKGDSTGNYEVKIANGTGEYLVYITALGRTPFRKRVTAAGADSTFVVDAKLVAIPAATLTAMRSIASRPRPSRTGGLGGNGQGLTANDKSPDGVFGQLSPELAANLEALAATLPGFTSTPEGLSAFGLSGANQSTLNGMALGIGDFPRDARMSARFQTSPYDPTKGGFAGAQLNSNLSGGTEISQRQASVLLDAPQLQLGQPSATLLGKKYYSTSLGYSADGAISPQKYFYNYAVQFRQRITPVSSLLDLDPASLSPNGVAADSARRLVQLLAAQQIPVTLSGIPGDQTSTSGSFIARFDKSAQPAKSPGGITSAPWWILAAASVGKSDASSLAPLTIPAFTNRQSNGSIALQGFYSTYSGPGRLWLSETQVAVAANTSRGDPYLQLPSGNVLVSSTLDDGATSVRQLAFGGNSSSHRRDDGWSAEIDNSTTFLPGAHTTRPIKIFAQGRYDGFQQVVGASRLGSFSFASLADLAANTPTSFSRTLNVPDRQGGEYSGSAAIGINWSIKTVNVIGGVRADANSYTVAPPLNPQAQSLFGLATDHVPNTIALSPRLGFSWTYKPSGTSSSFGPLARTTRGPTTIRGGIGRFRNSLYPTLIADALTSTGLPGGSMRLSCVGPATPIPDWNAYRVDEASIPTQCVGGASTFADASPNVIGFDRRFAPLSAWRASVGSTRTFNARTYLSVDATYSLNLDQQSAYDLNFVGAPKFQLLDERGRPVYVNGSSIVTSTGAVSPVEARMAPTFGRVTERRSDMRSEAKQITIYSIPNVRWFDPFVSASYTYTDVRARQRGFDGTTAGDPRVASWARETYTARHRIILGLGKGFRNLNLTAGTSLSSGTPFTPMVSGDVNGDGYFNDRAYIALPPPPSGDSAPRAPTPLEQLIARAPSRAGHCLLSQANRIADQNSCIGPWTATMNARLAYSGAFPRVGRRATVTLNLANPLSGLDLLLHGSGNLSGWGAQAFPDQTLLYVRGFNSSTQTFKYEVNPRFGSTSSGTTAILNPFRVTIDMILDLSRDRTAQEIEVALRPPRGMGGSRAPLDTIRMRLLTGAAGGNGPMDVYKYILSLKDSLALSADQIARLEAARLPFRAKIDSMYSELATYMVSLSPTFDGGAPAKRVRDVSKATWQVMGDQGKPIQAILSPTQMQLLWAPVIVTLTKPPGNSFWATSAANWL